MKGKEREILLDQLEIETRKKPVQKHPRPPLSSSGDQQVGDDQVEAAVAEATKAFRKVLEAA